MRGFELPDGDPGLLRAAAASIERHGAELEGRASPLTSAFATALDQWEGPRADTFRAASAGMQAQVKMAAPSLTAAAGLLRAYAGQLEATRTEVARLGALAAQRQSDAEASTRGMQPDQAEQEWQHATSYVAGLQAQADTERRHLRDLARRTAVAIDALTDTALPAGSKLTPGQIRRRVSQAYGISDAAAAMAHGNLSASQAWKALETPARAIPAQDVKDDGEVDWAEVLRDLNDKAVNAWTVGTLPSAGWAFAQLARNYSEYRNALAGLPKSYLGMTGPALDVPESTATDVDTLLDDIVKTAQLTPQDEAAFMKDFDLAASLEAAGHGGLPGFLEGTGHVFSALGLAGDAWTIVDPGVHNHTEANALRGAAALNAAGIGAAEFGGTLAGAAGLDAAVGWVPVAGQVVVVGTGVFLAGDWTYHHWDEVKGWGKDVGHLGSELGEGAAHAGKDVVDAVGGFLGL